MMSVAMEYLTICRVQASQAYVRLGECGIGCSMGIATGQVFMGLVGAASRCDFTYIGDIVNMAARINAKAAKDKLVRHLHTTTILILTDIYL